MRIAFLILLLVTGFVSQAQNRPGTIPLPTYYQIKPASREIYDHVNANGTSNQLVQGRIRLFDYPDSEAIYVINSKIVSNAVVRQRVAQPGMYIDSLSVSQPNDAGKRLIRIRLLPNRP
jgi:hypothetical protein